MSDLIFKILSSKAENNSLIIEGIASNSSVDGAGEKIIITSEALDTAIPIFLGDKKTLTTVRANKPNGGQIAQTIDCPNNGYMKYHHGGIDKDFNQVGKASIGKVLEMDYDKISDLDIDIRAKCEITNSKVIDLINRGYAKCFSLNWFWLVRTIDNINACFIDSNIAIHELSVTPNPVNKQAKFQVMNGGSKFAVGQRVFADQIPMAVKAVMKYENNVFYELEALVGSFKSDLIFPEQSLKAFVTNFNDNNLDQIIKKVILDKIRVENYNIPSQRVTNFKYGLESQITFGQNSQYKTSIKFNSDGKAEITKSITGAAKIIESIKAVLTGKIVVKTKTQNTGKIQILVKDIKIAS